MERKSYLDFPRIRSVRGWNLEGWRTNRRPWGVGDDGRIGNLLEKIQCERGDISSTRRIYFSNRRWTNQNTRRRSGTENIHFDTAATNSRRGHVDFLEESEGSLPPPHDSFPEAGEASNDYGPCLETSYAAITLNLESNFSRREKNHSPFHWNTLTSPEIRRQTWILCQKAASITFGISMGQETCLIHEQVPFNFLYWKKNLQTDFCGLGELASRPDHSWPELWKQWERMPSWRRGKSGHMKKLQLENARKLRGIYFIDPEDKEFKETIKNARKNLETSIAPVRDCVWENRSWRPYCREK